MINVNKTYNLKELKRRKVLLKSKIILSLQMKKIFKLRIKMKLNLMNYFKNKNLKFFIQR